MTEPTKPFVLSGLPGNDDELAGARALAKTFTQANFIAAFLNRKLDECPGAVNSIPVAIAGLNLAAKALSSLPPLRPEIAEFLLTTFVDACEGYGVNLDEVLPAAFALYQTRKAGGPASVQ